MSKIDFESTQLVGSEPGNKRQAITTSAHNRNKLASSEKGRNQSKSKISYYLSKSNFNDSTTLGDTSINQLSAIGGNFY